MQREKRTKITVRSDYPTSIASEAYGANVGACAFNFDYIARRSPELVVELMKLYQRCVALKDKPPLERNDPEFEKSYTHAMADEILSKYFNRMEKKEYDNVSN